MNNMKEILKTLLDVVDAGDSFIAASKEALKHAETLLDAARVFHTTLSGSLEKEPKLPEAKAEEAQPEKQTYTKEDVRCVLSEKAAAGHKKEVRNLLEKYGASKLAELPEENYSDVINEAKEIENE